MELSLRAKIRRLSVVFWWFAFQWWRITELFSGFRGSEVQAHTLESAVEALGWGARWKADPRGLDVMRHPRWVQSRIDAGEPVGDCDEHAGYILSSFIKNGDPHAFLISVQMWDPKTGKLSGHAIAGFAGPCAMVIADYSEPVWIQGWGTTGLRNVKWKGYPDNVFRGVARYVAEQYGVLPLSVAWSHVTTDRRDGIRFGKGDHYLFPLDTFKRGV